MGGLVIEVGQFKMKVVFQSPCHFDAAQLKSHERFCV